MSQLAKSRAATRLAMAGPLLRFFFDERQPFSPRQYWSVCALVCTIALLLRLPTLASRSFWIDETYSAWFAAIPLAELWNQVPRYETHPPLYYTLLKAWQWWAGSSEAGLRTFSVAASVASVFLVAVAAKAARLGALGERVALLAAFFLSLNSGNVFFAQQARPYALQTLAASIAILCSFMLLAQIASPGPSRLAGVGTWRWVPGLSLAAGLTLWLHNTGLFIALGIWTGLVISLVFAPGNRRRGASVVAVAGLLALLVWLPFLPTFIRQGTGLGTLDFWVKFRPLDLLSAWILPAGGGLLAIPALLLGYPAIVYLLRTNRLLACHLLILLAVAPITIAAYSYFVKPIFLARLFEWMAPLVMALFALGVFALRPRLRKPAAAMVVGLSVISTWSDYSKPSENWRQMLAGIAVRARPGDLVVAVPNEVQIPISYYWKPGALRAQVLYLPAPFPAPGLARRYVANLAAPAIAPIDIDRLRAELPHFRRVWLIERRPDLYDPRRTVAAAILARFGLVDKIDGNGATIRLFQKDLQRSAGAGPAVAAGPQGQHRDQRQQPR